MSWGRAPWWLYVAAGPFVAYAAVACSLLAWGPRPHGIISMDCGETKSCVVTRVQSGSPAEAAGFVPGDVVETWDGQPTEGWRLWRRFDRSWAETHTLTIGRSGQKLALQLDLGRRPWRYWTTVAGLGELVGALSALLTIGLALVVVLARPRDATARRGALFMATLGASLFTYGWWPPPGFSYVVGHLPLGLALWPILGFALALGTMHESSLAWAVSFPRPLFRSPWLWGLLWLPALVRIPIIASERVAIDLPSLGMLAFSLPQEERVLVFLRVLYTLAVPSVLLWSFRRSEDRNERRRLRVVLLGLGVGFVAVAVHLVILFFARAAFPGYLDSVWALLLRLLVLAVPLSLAYAILRHRLFDIRLIIRRGIQYAAARGLLVSLAPICAALLLVDLLLHGDEPLARILVERGWLYGALGVAGLALHSRRASWLTNLDKRFFRERYDARQLLCGVVEEIRAAGSLERAAAGVTERIAAALHPEQVSVLVRAVDQEEFRSIASAEAEATPAPRTLPSGGKLLALLRLIGKPLEIPITGTGWLCRQLPREEIDQLRHAQIEWIFPVGVGTGGAEAILALGPKLSEEPYSAEDQELLAAITSSLTLLLDRPSAGANVGTTAGLSAAGLAVPSGNLIAGRYRLGIPLGAGGMGTVFEAVDLTLDREVALKVMRPEIALAPDATARFKREARAAAAFTHPNVVTVHDFGVDGAGVAYLVMERLRGESMRDALRRDTRWPPARVVQVLNAVASAVDAAHERRLVHRDLKPENVFLAREAPKILDFGIAKPLPALDETVSVPGTAPGLVLGTPRYMSPEQARGGVPSPSWDRWALAVIAYEALTGTLPFPSPLTAQGYDAAVAGRVASTRAELGDAACVWDALFGELFAPEAARRPASAAAVAAAFAAAASFIAPRMGPAT